ncbi:hypothetical protein V7149_23115 [Bacillus sp. JJ1503]|uniref:hypothetical protein n=1 Tax=Bacillus sp. JJ1503 TaxID=3122956 RepID=UPI002FFFBF81
MEPVHPLKYVSQTFQVPLSDIAKELGVSRQTVNEWVGKRRKSIPEKHISKISAMFKLDERWFRKNDLLGSERLELQRIYIDRNATFIEFPDQIVDDEGNVHEITRSYSPEEEFSRHLSYRQRAEEVIEEVRKLIEIEVDAHDDFFQTIINEVISVTKSEDIRKAHMLQDVLKFLLYHDHEFGFFMIDSDKSKTVKLNELLELYKKV